MKRAGQKLIRDSAGTTNPCETAARLLEDLAMGADSNKEKEDCLAAARDFRLAAGKQPALRKRPKGDAEPTRRRPKSPSGGQCG